MKKVKESGEARKAQGEEACSAVDSGVGAKNPEIMGEEGAEILGNPSYSQLAFKPMEGPIKACGHG